MSLPWLVFSSKKTCAAIAALFIMVTGAGCASPENAAPVSTSQSDPTCNATADDVISGGGSTSNGSGMHINPEEIYDHCTNEAIDKYLAQTGDGDHLMSIGRGSTIGDAVIPLSVTEISDEVEYVVAYLCRQQSPSEYALSLDSESGEHTRLIRGDACVSNGVNIVSLPGDRLTSAVDRLSVSAENDTSIVANVYLR